MNKHRLCAWLGRTDIKASEGDVGSGAGPIAQALDTGEYGFLTLLSNYPEAESGSYSRWLSNRYPDLQVDLHAVSLSSPTEFAEIYENAVRVLKSLNEILNGEQGGNGETEDRSLTFHLSPGTPAMAATWILIASSAYPASLIETSREKGVRTVELPFDILAEYRPGGRKKIDEKLIGISDEMLPDSPAFDEIIHSTDIMQRTVNRARRIALFEVPVLLLGASGTGKELFAKAVHNASGRAAGPFISVNCGALPEGLIESELFGYIKGAFTGACSDKRGYIEAADGGTLFLDEIGELPLNVQVLLLRVLQDRKFRRVGSTQERESDFRLISATNRDLAHSSADGSFRSDLFHRIAVGVIKLPLLSSRGRDLDALADYFLSEINTQFSGIDNWKNKEFTVDARRLLHEYSWPGNVRELINTLTRACLWNPGQKIDRNILEDSLVRLGPGNPEFTPDGGRGRHATVNSPDAGPDKVPNAEARISGGNGPRGLLNRPIGSGFKIESVIEELAQHYLERAMEDSSGNKTRAAELLGLSNYQTLSNWLKKYGTGSSS